MQICGKTVNSSFQNFLYESYIKVVTDQSEESLTKWEAAGLYKQTILSQTDPTIAAGDPYITKLYNNTKNGVKFQLFTPVLAGICCQARLIPNLCEIKFIFTKSDPTFKVVHPSIITHTYDVRIHQSYLCLKRVHLYPSIEASLSAKLRSGTPAKYFFRNEYCRNFQISKAQTMARITDILLTSYLPNFLIIGFLEEKDYKGNSTASNFSFQPFGVSNLYLKSGSQIYPRDGEFKPVLNTTAQTSQFTREHFSLISEVCGIGMKGNFGNWIDREMWFKHFAFFKFHLARFNDNQLINASYLDQRIPVSNLDLHIQFARPLPENITVLIFTSSVETLSIKSNPQGVRECHLGYAL